MEAGSAKYLTTLRSPIAAVKKRSGPLDKALEEVNDDLPCSKIFLSPSSDVFSTRKPDNFASKHSGGVPLVNRLRRRSTKDKEKKRERWLLTRKTWRYMTDAGRKLIPDSYQAGSDNIDLIEEQFQRVCLSEPSFILWRRRTSYPGAISSSKRKLKLLSRHACASRRENRVEPSNNYYNTDRTIELLQTFLKLRDAYKTTTLLGTKTIRPDQTSSPSAQRPNFRTENEKDQIMSSGMTLETELTSRLKLLSNCFSFAQEGIQLQLGDAPEIILEDKVLLKKVYSALRKQQLHRTLHSKEPTKCSVNRSASLSSLIKIGIHESNTSYKNHKVINENFQCVKECDTSKISQSAKHSLYLDLNNVPQSFEFPKKCLVNGEKTERILKTCGTQTSFIQLSELKSLAEQYKFMVQNCNSQILEELDKQDGLNSSRLSCRKSSIDEDISQSVSDTIKRYLKMARKKSVQDSESNRFKSINYDKNLRNIKAKGEINPPGLNDGLNKAVQTLDAWPLIALDFIRGNESSINLQNAHLEWIRSEDERRLKQLEWKRNQKQFSDEVHTPHTIDRENFVHSTCTSAPTSPTSHSKLEKAIRTSSGLFSSSSHFISNILHGHSSSGSHFNTLRDKCSDLTQGNESVNMQKSKSLSNVGQFVTKKIWRSRSKSQNRRNISKGCTNLPLPSLKWYPSEKCVWISESGERFQIVETLLIKLSNTESDLVKDFALEKIEELNIGNIEDLKKTSKKRRIALKKKSLTTSFFDIGKKDDQNGRIVLFGTPLECCLTRDTKENVDIEDRSKYSLMSVFRGSGSNPGSVMKLNDNVRSYESLPSKSLEYGYMDPPECFSDSFTNMSKPSSSLSQLEIGNAEQCFEKPYQDQPLLMVPMFVNNCIEYLEENGLQKVGLFRVSTSKKRVKQLREEFDKNSHFRISVDTCPHDVATLLKEFLRDLPEPLLCDRLYSTFLKTQRIRNRRLQLEAISHLIRLLPIPHRDTLYVLLVFLAKVASHSDDIFTSDGNCLMVGNKMDSNNLATVFAPNILRSTQLTLPRDREQESMNDAINVVRTMINHYEEIFKISAELLNVIYTQVLESCPEKLYELISTKISGSECQEEEFKVAPKKHRLINGLTGTFSERQNLTDQPFHG
ncbi:uncharacterized protein RhoGAP102A isoform X3 [Drosophila takahashii]|uniref:uncharacterized protein RhoGAP102A isoform X3 n=1 Tax=Drosophila takahashii TaxID=29030 RepID=UPI001CF897E5|nr:uncharacterized protein LOC108054879 isoform X2 [Drosophila takahashii]